MAYDFPNTPTLGQISNGYTWDGEKWTSGTGFGAIYMSDAAPAAPVGSLWYQSSTGMLFVRYQDVDSAQWVSIPGGPGDGLRFGAQTLTVPQQTQARQNIYAAPFDALSYSGMQYNGSMDVSQESGGAARTLSGTGFVGGYVVDGWKCYSGSAAGTRVIACAQVSALGSPVIGRAFPNALRLMATTGQASLPTTDQHFVATDIEGYRAARLGWGNALGQPLTMAFWMNSTIAGTLAVSASNGAINDRFYIAEVPVGAGTWEYKIVTIPPCPTSNWDTAGGRGIAIQFGLGGGPSTQGPANVWTNGTILTQTAATTNFFATTGNTVYITGFAALPGTEAPSAARSAFIMRPYDQELILCRRYFDQPAINTLQSPAAGPMIVPHFFKSIMRVAPVGTTVTAPTYVNTSAATINSQTPDAAALQFSASAAGGYLAGWVVKFDARF